MCEQRTVFYCPHLLYESSRRAEQEILATRQGFIKCQNENANIVLCNGIDNYFAKIMNLA